VLPMIDLALSKEAAIPAHIFGMLYDSWKPNVEEEGTSVFLQGYGNRGPNNERKKIYYSALTPDLYSSCYADKIKGFLGQLFKEQNANKPLMEKYYESYFDMYWDLHLGVKEDNIPAEIREIGNCFMRVLGYWYPTLQNVHDDYMRVRDLRNQLKNWIDERVRAVKDREIPNPEKTFVYYWLKNGEEGPNFRKEDITFECFHNFLAFSQWGHTLYRITERLLENGDQKFDSVRSRFKETMSSTYDKMDVDGSPFTPLDRFVMELFRTISPNDGSISSLPAIAQFFGEGYTGFSTIITPHPEASTTLQHWDNPEKFDPDRYKTATTSEQNNEAKVEEVGLAQCPFSKESFAVKDGRKAELTNSAFGAVYAKVGGTTYEVCDDAGYAPFGFGYRRCAGEFLTVEFFKELLRKVSKEGIKFKRLSFDPANPDKRCPVAPVAPATVVEDNIGFVQEETATSAS
jgi:cytochrome P450